jgi:hypothetical protein
MSAAPYGLLGHRCTTTAMKTKRGAWRCRLHGGLSTGPTTVEGRERISATMRARWALRRSDTPRGWTTLTGRLRGQAMSLSEVKKNLRRSAAEALEGPRQKVTHREGYSRHDNGHLQHEADFLQ